MKTELEQQITKLCSELFAVDVAVVLTRPDEQFGDYATNIALQLAGRLNRNPREIAQQVADAMKQGISEITSVSVAGPGFINLKVADAALFASKPTVQPVWANKKILLEYSDPNPFKPLHGGHLYTTLVGDMLARLVDQGGGEVVRLNYGGDVGLHVGKSMWAIMQHLGGEYPEKLTDIPMADRPTWLGNRYVEGNNAYEDNPSAKEDIIACNRRVYELQQQADHDSAFAQIYWTCRQWSYDYFAVLYAELAVVPFDRFIPESEVTDLGLQTVREQLTNGVYRESDGAVVFQGDQYGLHTRVFINSAGLPTYEAKDVGLLLTKWRDYHFDQSIVITANEQSQYMEVMLKSVEQFAPEPAQKSRHITHGMVKLRGGVKMSSRKGNIVTALEIIAAARQAGSESGTDPSEGTILAAIKYALAKNRIGGDIVYDPKESIALEGNSGPYLQYAHARARSILVKTTAVAPDSLSFDTAERSLARKVGEYPEVLDLTIAELLPHYICTYLYELAQTFNRFYEHNRVIGDEREVVRAELVRRYADTLKSGLELLGIAAPDAM